MVDNIANKWWESDAATLKLLAGWMRLEDDYLCKALREAQRCIALKAKDTSLKARFDLIEAVQAMDSGDADFISSAKSILKRIINKVDDTSPIAITAKIYYRIIKIARYEGIESLDKINKEAFLYSLLEDCKRLKKAQDNEFVYCLISSFEGDCEELSIAIPDELSFDASPFRNDLLFRLTRAEDCYGYDECTKLWPNAEEANAFAVKAVQVFETLKLEGCVAVNKELGSYYGDRKLTCYDEERSVACWQAILDADDSVIAPSNRASAAYWLSGCSRGAPEESLRLMKLSLELGSVAAAYRLGHSYEYGDETLGVEANTQKAFEIYQRTYDLIKADKSGCRHYMAEGVVKLARSYFEGSEVLSRDKDTSKALDLLYGWVMASVVDGDCLCSCADVDFFRHNEGFRNLYDDVLKEVSEKKDVVGIYCCKLIGMSGRLSTFLKQSPQVVIKKLTAVEEGLAGVDLFKCVLDDEYLLKRIKQSWLLLLWDEISKKEGQQESLLKAIEEGQEKLERLCLFLIDRGDSLVKTFRKGCHAEKVDEVNLNKILQEAVDYYGLVPESSALALRSIESMLLLLSFPVLGIRGDASSKDDFMVLCSDASVKALIEKYNRTLAVRTLLSESEQQTKRVINGLLAEWHKKADLDLPEGIEGASFGLQVGNVLTVYKAKTTTFSTCRV